MSSWKIELTLNQKIIPIIEEVLYGLDEDNAPTLSNFEIIENDDIRLLEAFFTTKPDIALFTQRLKDFMPDIYEAIYAGTGGITLTEFEDKDWVSESQKLLQPVDTGLFFVYGSHDQDKIPSGRITLLVEAGQAFGTGQHETTHGCLLAIEDLSKELTGNKMPKIALDLGCGSGLLALAMSKVWPIAIVASDIDPIATDTTIQNTRANNIPLIYINTRAESNSDTTGIMALTSDGFAESALNNAGPYDVIIANILAKPLQEMAADIAANLAPHGTLILSGLLDIQEEAVCQAYANEGLSLVTRYVRGSWHSLMLRHPI